ncbi:hypothetical protein D9Q98_005390 [Chlorella vulgaris]|uniref:EamA domain-containing protein n=1 Tax=Chlorella vulgaris TaxID=3077 RepID=A0A9D4YW23_CHLVU|nr:hypothetical protein D9Q98_005390 [Chlorella vulgaris]
MARSGLDLEPGQQAARQWNDDEDDSMPLVSPAEPGAVAAPASGLLVTAVAAVWNNGVICVLASALAFTVASTVVKFVESRIPVFQIVLARGLFSALATTAACRLKGIPTFGHGAPLILKLARGTIGATAMVLSYESIVRLPLGDSTVIFFLSPIFTALLGYLLLGESFGLLTSLGCCASLAGVVMVAQPGSAAVDWSQRRLLGMAFGFTAALLAAGAYICIRQIGKREHSLTVAFYFHIHSVIFSIIPLSLGYPHFAVLPNLLDAALLLLLAVCSFVANLLVSRALQIELAAKATALNFTQVIFAWIIGSYAFGDPITGLGVAGTLLIAAGVISVHLDKATQHVAAPANGIARDCIAKDGVWQHGMEVPAPVLESQNRGWWQRWRERWRPVPTVPDHSGRLKAKSSFKVELSSVLPQYIDADGSLIQSRASSWLSQPGDAESSRQDSGRQPSGALLPLPAERPMHAP